MKNLVVYVFSLINRKENEMANKMTRRQMLKLMALAGAGTVLAACGQPATPEVEPPSQNEPEPTDAPVKAEPVEISMVEMFWGVPQDTAVLNRIANYLSGRAQDDGVNIQFKSILLDDRTAQYPLLYASGEKFTFAFDAPWLVMNSLIDQEYLLPLENMLPEYAPKIVEVTGQQVIDANFIKGHLYGIVAWFYFSQTSGIILREDLRKAYGVPEPDGTWPSIEPYLDAVKANNPDMIPFVVGKSGQIGFGQGDDNFNSFAAPWYTPGNKLSGACIPDLWAETRYENLEDQPEFREFAELSYKWWDMGYLGELPEGVNQNDAFDNGICAAVNNNEPDFKYAQQQAQLTNDEVVLKGYDMSGQRAGKVLKNRRNRQWNFIVFNNQAPEEEQIAGLQFFNWLYSDQANVDAWLFGEDGVDHNFGPDMTFTAVEGAEGVYRRNWFVGGVPGTLERLPANTPEHAKETLTYLSTPENFKENPIEGFDPDIKPVETQYAAYTAVYPEARYPIVSGEMETVEALANWTKVLDDAGRPELMAEFQNQLDAWIAENL